ncbi:RHNO1 protein, partial [Alectura lathami]|nr:RHNO1 protein [Alectura lathami]
MPPKKKCARKAGKAELVFLERPWEGPIHCCETPLSLSENPRRVPTKPVDQNTSAAWVCPQFETTQPLELRGRQKKHRVSHKPQNQDGNHDLLHAGGASRRALACRFPPLAFETSEGRAVSSPDALSHAGKNAQLCHGQSRERTAAKGDIRVDSPENRSKTPSWPEVAGPPDTRTPQQPSAGSQSCSRVLPQTSSHAWHAEHKLLSGVDPCRSGQSAAILVTDTPEHEYGVKVTWRQRPHLLKYLRDRG